MKPHTNNLYQPQEFAELAGVTVRALHRYDRLGLLRPVGRTEAGYRVYRDRDFARPKQNWRIRPEIQDFIRRAIEAS